MPTCLTSMVERGDTRWPGEARDRARTLRRSAGTSEVGRLRTVLLHRPGTELRRLTPRNNDQLLFDGVPWVDRAQEEHDAFAEALRDRGVEVLHLDRLLAEVLSFPSARAELIAAAVDDPRLGATLQRVGHRAPGRARPRGPRRPR